MNHAYLDLHLFLQTASIDRASKVDLLFPASQLIPYSLKIYGISVPLPKNVPQRLVLHIGGAYASLTPALSDIPSTAKFVLSLHQCDSHWIPSILKLYSFLSPWSACRPPILEPLYKR